jgi:ribose/xylose/arabinose/galactoside ABC-type transport system permease subunit
MVDNILNTISSTISGDLTFGGIAIAMLAAIIFGLAISLTYMYTHKETYQQSMVITLSMLPVILSIIILFVGSNVARAFSLAGTLSIIRFRSAPGDPVDIGYIFFDIAAGLACGVGLFLYGAAFVLILCLFMIILNKVKFAEPKSLTKSLKINSGKS